MSQTAQEFRSRRGTRPTPPPHNGPPEDFRMPFGKFKGKKLGDVRLSYLIWLSNKSGLYGPLAECLPRVIEAKRDSDSPDTKDKECEVCMSELYTRANKCPHCGGNLTPRTGA